MEQLKKGDLLNNKGGHSWRITARGRRLLDNLTILLFEHNGDFDEVELLKASKKHLGELAKHYNIDLNIEAQIIRFFNDILTEIDETDINILDAYATNKIRNTLQKAESFYRDIRALLLSKDKTSSLEVWSLYSSLAKRHNVVGKAVEDLNQHIGKISANIDIQEALNLFLNQMTQQEAMKLYQTLSFTQLKIFPSIATTSLLEQTKPALLKEKAPTPPDYTSFPIKSVGMGEFKEKINKKKQELLNKIEKSSRSEPLYVSNLIDMNNWDKSVLTLVNIADLSSEGKIKLLEYEDIYIKNKSFKILRNTQVILSEK